MTFQEREAAEVAAYDKQYKYNLFKERNAQKIKDGMTLEVFSSQYNTTDIDVEMFKRLQQEVETDKRNEAAFLEGFNKG